MKLNNVWAKIRACFQRKTNLKSFSIVGKSVGGNYYDNVYQKDPRVK